MIRIALLFSLLVFCSSCDFKSLRSRENTRFELRNPPARVKGLLVEVLRESIVIHEAVSDAVADTIHWSRIERVTFVNGVNKGLMIGGSGGAGAVLGCLGGCLGGVIADTQDPWTAYRTAGYAALGVGGLSAGVAYLMTMDKSYEIEHPNDLQDLRSFASRR